MQKRPDPTMFAHYSYILAIVSSGILGLAFLLGWIPVPAAKTVGSTIIWLVLVTGSVGAFMGYAAQADFKVRSPSSPEAAHKAKFGFRLNLAALSVTILMGLLTLGLIVFTRITR